MTVTKCGLRVDRYALPRRPQDLELVAAATSGPDGSLAGVAFLAERDPSRYRLLLPLRPTAGAGAYRIASFVAQCVSSPTSTLPTGAAVRARRGVDHVAGDHRLSQAGLGIQGHERFSVLTAIRTFRSRGISGVHGRCGVPTASAARTAGSASSPNAVGAPKTPTTASPMNFSTTPPKDSISVRTVVVRAKQRLHVLRIQPLGA